MKKKVLAGLALALSASMVFALAACGSSGAVAEAKNMKGEEVTQQEWDAAVEKTSMEPTENATLALSAEQAEAGSNFKVEYQFAMDYSVKYAGLEGDIVSVEPVEASMAIDVRAAFTIANGLIKMDFEYETNLTGSENLLALLEAESISEKGSLTGYVDLSKEVIYQQNEQGVWVEGSFDTFGGDVSMYTMMFMQIGFEFVDLSYMDYADYEFDAEAGGYVQAGSGTGSGLSAELVIKFKSGELAALYGEMDIDFGLEGAEQNGSAEFGMLYSFGGQSVTLPTISETPAE